MAGEQGSTLSAAPPRRCFVVMGFGVKTDLATGRQLNLDKSYRTLIRPVVLAQGLECVRADELRFSGAIDVPMYEHLLSADIVIADLSTANPNAFYELGIRHALRPHSTVVISESKLPYPFDLNHVRITGYTHAGDDIGYDEVMRFREELGRTLEAVLQTQVVDSPIYTFLQDLQPPSRRRQVEKAISKARAARSAPGPASADPHGPTLATLVAQGESAIRESRFGVAKARFTAALRLCAPDSVMLDAFPCDNTYLRQRLVLATYKAKQPSEAAALDKALKILAPLEPDVSNDPETVGLAGAIEKRLYDQGRGDAHLDRAVRCYGRGYFLRDDPYNGVNLAYLLSLRADQAPDADDCDRIADLVWANRIRREVLVQCDRALAALRDQPHASDAVRDVAGLDRLFWLVATKAECHAGLGEADAFNAARAEAAALDPPAWMLDTLDQQVSRLQGFMGRRGHLLQPARPARSARPGRPSISTLPILKKASRANSRV